MFNRYYQDEILYLRELGAEFARAHPAAAHFLAAPGSDPDVERLLEGFAFLSAKIRQKLDDELPEVTHGLMTMLWPHYLRPVPSMSILEFLPVLQALRQPQVVKRGVAVQSIPVEGTACQFRTAYDVVLNPLSLETVQLAARDARSQLWLGFKLWNQAKPEVLNLKRLRIHLHGDPTFTFALYHHLRCHVKEAWVTAVGPGERHDASPARPLEIRPVGFEDDEALLPYPARSFAGYRLLQEYFALQEKFLFLDFTGVDRLVEVQPGERFWVEVRFDRALPPSIRPTPEEIRLYCTPIVNLFAHEADPIRVDHSKVEYRLRPAGASPFHYEVFSIDRVVGYQTGSAEEKEIPSFHSFSHETSGREKPHYHFTRMRESVVDERADTFISFVGADGEGALPPVETVSVRITSTNRRMAEALRVGDVNVPTDSSPEFVRFRNLTVPTPSVPPPLTGDLHWRLLSHLSLNYLSLTNVEALRGILSLYNFLALRDPRAQRANVLRLEGIHKITTRAAETLARGSIVRGADVTLELLEDHFAGDGDLYLFSTVLNEFLSLYTTLNSFTRLTVRGVQRGEVYQWPAGIGRRVLL